MKPLLSYIASMIPWDNSEVSDKTDAKDLQQAVKDAFGQSFSESTKFEAYENFAVRETTSDSWVDVDTFTSDEILTAGRYYLGFAAEFGQSKAAKKVGSEYSWKPNANANYNVLSDVQTGIATANEYDIRSSFFIVELASDDRIDMKVRFGQTTETGTGRVRNVGLILWRVGDILP